MIASMLGIGEHLLVGRDRPAAVLLGERRALVVRAREAGDDLDLVGTLRSRRPARPTTSPCRCRRREAVQRPSIYFQLAPIDSTAACAIFRSVSQSPPLTPTPPMHSPSTRIGHAAFHRGPALRARRRARGRAHASRRAPGPTAPLAVVGRLLDAAHTALVVQECSGVEAAAVHALQHHDVAAGVDDAARDRDLGLARLVDGGRPSSFGRPRGSGAWRRRCTWSAIPVL